MTPVACVIANFNGAAYLPECLASLLAEDPAPAEILVVDGGSTDESREIALAHGARVVSADNRGLGHLYNLGVEAVAAPFVFLANNDIALNPRCLGVLAETLAADERRFAADPAQVAWDDGRLIHARTLLRPSSRPFTLAHVEPAEDVVPTLAAGAGGMLVRRSTFIELGGFDETMFLDWEDVDLCWRAWQRGLPSVFVPAASFRHRVGGSDAAAGVARRRSISTRHNRMRFALKCLPAGPAAGIVLWELMRGAKHPTATGAAVAQILRRLPEIARQRSRIGPSRALYSWMRAGLVGTNPV